MRTVLHRELPDIPTHKFDDPEVCPSVNTFNNDCIQVERARAFAERQRQGNKRIVVTKRPFKHPVNMSNSQADCYEFVVDSEKLGSPVFISVLKLIFARNTVNSLLKANLFLDIGNDKLKTD